jgi:spore coat polysaccharide biosynthesis protein SpsF
MIKAEMASKSRIATWVYDGPNYENLELLKLKQEYLDAHPEVWQLNKDVEQKENDLILRR